MYCRSYSKRCPTGTAYRIRTSSGFSGCRVAALQQPLTFDPSEEASQDEGAIPQRGIDTAPASTNHTPGRLTPGRFCRRGRVAE
ncbi:hypothetical protein EYF80_042587 [Liparis tanakae]|uniref:Uncharacterized protein n=1 Tax=Liparis tanakae TaxID=230148 RepID=A0A4Z2G0W6_9TELE|nr:hypothetical protein EYF80_042587 [Liparis tanakae]